MEARQHYPFDMADIHLVDIGCSLFRAPKGKRYRKYTARAGLFFAELKDYEPGTPL